MVAGHPTATPHAEALALAEHGVAVYWRPGCPYSGRLRMAVRRDRGRIACVGQLDRPLEHDRTGVHPLVDEVDRHAEDLHAVLEGDAGRAYVASVNDGNETVPTVVIDGIPHTNPHPALVKRALDAQ